MQHLLIFREKKQARMLQKAFKYENIHTDIVFSEQEALAKIFRWSYDSIIIKNTPPSIDAKKFCAHLRNVFKELPIIIFDPWFRYGAEKEIFQSGATAILPPPFSFHSLLQAIKQIHIINNRAQKKTEDLKNKHLLLNTDTREVKRENRCMELKNKEFSLLEFLMKNAGKILSRSAILEHVWDRNTNILTNTVDVHISGLRKKIDNGFSRKLIETVHFVG